MRGCKIAAEDRNKIETAFQTRTTAGQTHVVTSAVKYYRSKCRYALLKLDSGPWTKMDSFLVEVLQTSSTVPQFPCIRYRTGGVSLHIACGFDWRSM